MFFLSSFFPSSLEGNGESHFSKEKELMQSEMQNLASDFATKDTFSLSSRMQKCLDFGLQYSSISLPNQTFFSCITGFQSIHMIEVDPKQFAIKLVKALDDGLGRETALSLSRRYGAIAAINGGFFSIGGTYDGKASGALKISKWVALPLKPRAAIGWSYSNTSPVIDRILTELKVIYQGEFLSLEKEPVFNKERKVGDLAVYTPAFHRTTLTYPDGEEVIVREGKVDQIRKAGSSTIPENGFVLSIQKEHATYGSFEVEDELSFSIKVLPQYGSSVSREWDQLDYILGGTPLLLHEGKKVQNYSFEKTIRTFLTNRHARTAIGVLPNGNWLFVVVDKTGYFDGMTIEELADLMLLLGCEEALNLDGGGSSTMVYQNEVKNCPRGDEDEDNGKKTLRRLSDAIVILPK